MTFATVQNKKKSTTGIPVAATGISVAATGIPVAATVFFFSTGT